MQYLILITNNSVYFYDEFYEIQNKIIYQSYAVQRYDLYNNTYR